MNICKNCSSKYVCRIADFVNKNSNIVDITVNSCMVNSEARAETTKSASPNNYDYISPIFTQERSDITGAGIAEFVTPKSYKNFRDESNNLEAEISKRKKKIVSIVKELPSEKKKIIACGQCGGATYEDDIGKCSVCGKDICSGCGVESIETKERFCNECWKGQ